MYFPNIKFRILIEYIHMEGTVSQTFNIGPSFDFMKSRNIIMKKIVKIFPFFDIKSELRPISKS